jgi:hypothetical protein
MSLIQWETYTIENLWNLVNDGSISGTSVRCVYIIEMGPFSILCKKTQFS